MKTYPVLLVTKILLFSLSKINPVSKLDPNYKLYLVLWLTRSVTFKHISSDTVNTKLVK